MRKIILGTAAFGAIAAAAVIAYGPQKANFAGRCYANGKPLADCVCMFEARHEFLQRADLPPVYAELARAWALDSDVTYRSKLYSTVFWQSVRAVPVVREVMIDGGKGVEKTTPDKLWDRIMKSLSEQVIGQVGKRLGVTIVPWVQGAKTASEAAEPVWDFTKARAVVSKHCGGRMHTFVAPIETAYGQVKDQLTIYQIVITDTMKALRSRIAAEGFASTVKDAAQRSKAATTGWYQRMKDKARASLGW